MCDLGNGSIKYIDPFKGTIKKSLISVLSNEVVNSGGNVKDLIDSDEIREIIEIVVDSSGSMSSKLDGNALVEGKFDESLNQYIPTKDVNRYFLTIESIFAFINRSFGFRLPHLYGLTSYF